LIFLGPLSYIGSAQNPLFSKLYNYNQTGDGGSNVFIKADGNYFITGTAFGVGHSGFYSAINMTISSDGNMILHTNLLDAPKTNYYLGVPGALKKLNAGYASPYSPTLKFSQSGLVVYDSTGDTLFTKTYTDTTLYAEGGLYIDILSDNSFLMCGNEMPLVKIKHGVTFNILAQPGNYFGCILIDGIPLTKIALQVLNLCPTIISLLEER